MKKKLEGTPPSAQPIRGRSLTPASSIASDISNQHFPSSSRDSSRASHSFGGSSTDRSWEFDLSNTSIMPPPPYKTYRTKEALRKDVQQ
jgi:hypothetical protein